MSAYFAILRLGTEKPHMVRVRYPNRLSQLPDGSKARIFSNIPGQDWVCYVSKPTRRFADDDISVVYPCIEMENEAATITYDETYELKTKLARLRIQIANILGLFTIS